MPDYQSFKGDSGYNFFINTFTNLPITELTHTEFTISLTIRYLDLRFENSYLLCMYQQNRFIYFFIFCNFYSTTYCTSTVSIYLPRPAFLWIFFQKSMVTLSLMLYCNFYNKKMLFKGQ